MTLSGHKPTPFDFEYLRRTVFSEYDKTRDTWERWRTDPQFFAADIFQRSRSIIPFRHVLEMAPRTKQWTIIDNAFCTRVNFLCMVHVAWRDAALLFEELAARGLHTAAAIERAYQKDTALLWRLVSAMHIVSVMWRKMWANFQQLIATSEYYKQVIKSWRDLNIPPYIVQNETEIKKRRRLGEFTDLDEAIIEAASERSPNPIALFMAIEEGFERDPTQKNKFSAELFEAIGDLAAAAEFEDQFMKSEFGDKIIKYSATLEQDGSEAEKMRSILYYMDPAKLPAERLRYWDRAGEATMFARRMEGVWNALVWELTVEPVWRGLQDRAAPGGLDCAESLEMPVGLFNQMWDTFDKLMWAKAAALDRKGEEGRVAAAYGLWKPMDPNRPQASARKVLLVPLVQLQPVNVAPKSAQPYVQHIPVAQPGESVAQSGHAYLSQRSSDPKEKVKTRGEAANDSDAAAVGEPESEKVEVPEDLPLEFKLGKKVLKVFHRILEPPEDEKENAPAKGQIRWDDFEHAMKRIGFEIVQTAGSSVRFDPPASRARPITFHRPHPESLLTPHAIKWIGARLKRTYGWTTETFQRTEGEKVD
uniref:Type II toxin-antitoxin system HicA family toxin n=1 Tax=Mycena chlorophos TaxID=658473 RepID=A0ABQ0LK07_MYCCL|nr:predicted protein [Mycena chlorophos]